MTSRKAALGGRCLLMAQTLAESLRRRDAVRAMTPTDGATTHVERLNVLFVCSRNQWRSPTGERVWRGHPNVNARSAGTSAGARRVVGAADLAWADVVLVMEDRHKFRLMADYRALLVHKPLHVLDIPDDYEYMAPELVELLSEPVAALLCLTR